MPFGEPDVALSAPARDLLLLSTLVALACAFLPPLPAVAGKAVPPWMVYRVLWLLPLAPLAALAADALAARLRRREATATVLLLALALPVAVAGAASRLGEVRTRVTTPRSNDFAAMVAAVSALPHGALVVAAPELAERLPALTGRRVVAGLDRSTVVFAGSREAGEARLRARAALLLGDDDATTLTRAAGLRPSHAVYDPRAAHRPRCRSVLHSGEAYAACALDLATPTGGTLTLEAAAGDAGRLVATGACGEMPRATLRDPWSATPPVLDCEVDLPADAAPSGVLLLRVETGSGRAADELRVRVATGGPRPWVASATVRIVGDASTFLALPPAGAGPLAVSVSSSFLPALHPVRISVEAR